MSGAVIRLPLDTAGLPPMMTKNAVRSTSGMGNKNGCPNINAAATMCGSWSNELAEKRLRVCTVIAELKPERARALLLRHAGFSYRELALILKMNPASVGQMLLRAQAEFARRYRELSEAKP